MLRAFMRLINLPRALSPALATPLFLLAACGGDAPPPAAVPPPAPVAPAPPPPNLSAVPEPGNLIFSARVNHPDQILASAAAWTGLPIDKASELATAIAGEEMGPLIDPTKPLDSAITYALSGTTPKVNLAVAAGLVSMDDAKAKLGQKHKLVPEPNGVYRLAPMNAPDGPGDKPTTLDDDSSDSGSDATCALAPAFGPSSARLVCGDSRASLAELLPYLTRTAPRASFDSDVHLQVRTETFKSSLEMVKQFLPMAIGGMPSAASSQATFALLDAMSTDVAQLSGDLRKWTMDAKATEAGLHVHSVMAMQSARSLVAQLLVAHPERADVPPAAFFKLPADADAAFYTRAGDPALIDHPIHLLTAALGELAETAGISAADSKAITTAITDALTLGGTQAVYAHGVDSEAVKKALADWRGAEKTEGVKKQDAAFALVQARIGWWVGSGNIPAAKLNVAMKEIVSAAQRPSVGKVWKETFEGVNLPRWHVGGAVKGAPAGTMHYEIEVPSFAKLLNGDMAVGEGRDLSSHPGGAKAPKTVGDKSAPKPPGARPAPPVGHTHPSKPLPFHLVVVSDGDQSWYAFGCDENIALQHLKVAMTGAGADTLASRPGLDGLKSAHATMGGFLDAHNFAGTPFVDWLLNTESVRVAAGVESAKGTTPMLITSAAAPPGEGAPAGSAIADIDVPKDAFQEITRTVIASIANRH